MAFALQKRCSTAELSRRWTQCKGSGLRALLLTLLQALQSGVTHELGAP